MVFCGDAVYFKVVISVVDIAFTVHAGSLRVAATTTALLCGQNIGSVRHTLPRPTQTERRSGAYLSNIFINQAFPSSLYLSCILPLQVLSSYWAVIF